MKKSAFNKPVNGICRQVYSYEQASVRDKHLTARPIALTINPNPAKAGTKVSVSGAFPARQVRLLDAAGRKAWSTSTKYQTELSIPVPQTAGQYIVEWIGDEEKRASGVVIVE